MRFIRKKRRLHSHGGHDGGTHCEEQCVMPEAKEQAVRMKNVRETERHR